ncbi:MAG: amidohydrolase family protein, partial [Clostridia bacterium]
MILLKDCFRVVRPRYGAGIAGSAGIASNTGAVSSADEDLSGVDILIDGKRIKKIAKGIPTPEGCVVVDASRHVVMPGLVNTHHHFYQTLTRNIPAVQDAKLFKWLVYLYEVWKGVDEEAVYWSSKLALAELAKTGCTLTTDHHYLYPQSFREDLPGLQFKAASEIGLRFAPTRGSMSRSKKDGGLPPDTVVQDEDTILAESEAALRKYHDKAPDAMRKLALAPCSPFSVSEQSMKDAAALARRYGARLHTHLA